MSKVGEYAGQYLDTVGQEVSSEKLETIWAGQVAWQRLAGDRDTGPFLVQDTDLFNVVCQYRHEGWEVPDRLVVDAVAGASDMYFLLPDTGEDEPGFDRALWLQVAGQHELAVQEVPAGTDTEQVRFMQDVMFPLFREKVAPVEQFQRTNIDPDPVTPVGTPATVAV